MKDFRFGYFGGQFSFNRALCLLVFGSLLADASIISVAAGQSWQAAQLPPGRPRSQRLPPPPVGPAGGRLEGLTCAQLFRMNGGLNHAQWAQISNVPLDDLKPQEFDVIKTYATECERGGSLDDRFTALSIIDSSMRLSNQAAARARVDQAVRQRQVEVDAREKLLSESKSLVRTTMQTLATLPTDNECKPPVAQLRESLIARMGYTAYAQSIEQSSDWKALLKECDARAQRVTAARASDQKRQEQAALDGMRRAAMDYAADAQASKGAAVSRLNMPAATLQTRLILKPNTLIQALFGSVDMTQFTFGDWIAMVMQNNAQATFNGVVSDRLKDVGFSIKVPGARTMSFFVHPDGGELFLSAVGAGDAFDELTSDDDTINVSSALIVMSGLVDQLTKVASKQEQ